jgi:hypothetical protein
MTTKEKAKELVDKFARIDGYQDSIDLSKCEYEKQRALIAVNELIKEARSRYWYDVKQEIEKL